MKRNKLNIHYLYILFLLALMLGLVFSGIYIFNSVFMTGQVEDVKTINVEIDWEKQFPFKDKSFEQTGDEVNKKTSIVYPIVEKYKSLVDSISNFVGNHIQDYPLNYDIEKIGIYVRQMLYTNARFSMNAIQQIDSGQIIEIETLTNSEKEISFSNNCNDLKLFLDEKNIPLYYIQPMVKYDETGEYKSFVNENRDILLSKIQENGIHTIDLRQSAKIINLSVDDAFYKTDHHWKTSIGLWASREIISQINNSGLKFNINLLDEKNFHLKTYKNSMFGSYGNMAGTAWACHEDHTIYYPNYNTKFHIDIPNKQIDDIGSFYDVLFFNDKIDEMVNGEAGYIYETTCYGNTPLTKIINVNNTSAPKVLVIRDSFALATLPYLACVTSELDSIDVRKSNGNFSGSVRTYIEETNPDVVMIILNNSIPYDFK